MGELHSSSNEPHIGTFTSQCRNNPATLLPRSIFYPPALLTTNSFNRALNGSNFLPEQSAQGALTYHATLKQRRQTADLVVVRFTETTSVVQVQGERVIAENLEGLVVVTIHVSGQEVEDRHVHEIQKPSSLVVRWQFSHDRAVFGIYEESCCLLMNHFTENNFIFKLEKNKTALLHVTLDDRTR